MKKSTIITVVVFIGLLVAVIFRMGGKPERGITRISFASIDTETIDRIAVTGKNPVEINRRGERWVLGDGREADGNAVKRFIEAILKIQSSDLVTSDAARFAEFEVDEEKGARVVVFSGDQAAAEFIVGKSASGGAHVRVGETVYLVKQVYPYLFSKKFSAWHKLKLFDKKLDEVARVEVSPAGGKPYVLIRKDDKWVLEDTKVVPSGFRFDHSAARSLVSAVINSRAKEIVIDDPGAEKTGLGKGYDVLAFVDNDKRSHELHLGAANDKEDVYMQVAGENDIYFLSKHSARSLRKQVTDLRDMKMIDLDSEKVTKLSIVDGKRTLVLERQGAEWKIGKSSEKIPEDFELDSQAVQRHLRSLANARATGISANKSPAKTGLTRPQAMVKAILEDGSAVALEFGKQTKDDNREVAYARGNIDEEIYMVAKGTRDNLTGGITTFKKRPVPRGMPDLDPKALSNLPPDVRANLMRQMQMQKQQQKMIEAMQPRLKKKEKEKKASK